MDVLGGSLRDASPDPQFPGFPRSQIPLPGGVAVTTDWLRTIEAGIAVFMNDLVIARLVPTLAAFFVLRAILDSTEGNSPLRSVLTAMFSGCLNNLQSHLEFQQWQ